MAEPHGSNDGSDHGPDRGLSGAPSTVPPMPPPKVAVRGRGERLALALVWLLAAVAPALLLVAQTDPEQAVRVVQTGTEIATQLLVWVALLGILAALLVPPIPAWCKLKLAQLRLSLASDRGPLLRALSELKHFASAQRHFEVGRIALARREYSLALPHLHAALELDPRSPASQHHFAMALFAVGYLPQAAQAFANAETLEPGHAFGDALLHMARCADLLDRHEEALAAYELHERRHGGGPKSRYWHALALDGAGRTAEATTVLALVAARPERRLTPEENWFRALARFRMWTRSKR